MSNRSEKVGMYVTPDQKRELKDRADAEDKTLSAYCHGIIEQHLNDELFAEKAEEVKIERRLEELAGLAREEVEEAAEDIRQTQQKAALHTIALWELLKTDAGPAHRKEAMTEATQRLREDLVKAGIDPDTLGEPATQQGQSTQTDESSESEQADPPTETGETADGDWKDWKSADDTDEPAETSTSSDSSARDAEGDDWKTWKTDDGDDDTEEEDDDVYIDRDWDI